MHLEIGRPFRLEGTTITSIPPCYSGSSSTGTAGGGIPSRSTQNKTCSYLRVWLANPPTARHFAIQRWTADEKKHWMTRSLELKLEANGDDVDARSSPTAFVTVMQKHLYCVETPPPVPIFPPSPLSNSTVLGWFPDGEGWKFVSQPDFGVEDTLTFISAHKPKPYTAIESEREGSCIDRCTTTQVTIDRKKISLLASQSGAAASIGSQHTWVGIEKPNLSKLQSSRLSPPPFLSLATSDRHAKHSI